MNIKPNRDLIILLSDAVVAFLTILVSSMIRLEFGHDLWMRFHLIVITASLAIPIRLLSLRALGIYRIYWKYISWREIRKLCGSVLLGSLLLISVYLFISPILESNVKLPRSIIGIDFFVFFGASLIVRVILYNSFRIGENKRAS
jgi:FlaA1/EpsC-like NDP-sugar epimerase